MPTPDAKQCCQAAELDAIKSDDVQLQQRIMTVMRHRQFVRYADPEALREYTAAGAVEVLGQLLIKDWPLDANFALSLSPLDEVVSLNPTLDPSLLGYSAVSGQLLRALTGTATVLQRSLRRVVLDMLADISMHDPKGVTKVLGGLGLFTPNRLPLMLHAALSRYIPGQTQQQQVEHVDQGQQIAERLLAVTASAAAEGGLVATFLAQHCTVIISRCFIDPWQVKWERKHKDRALELAARAIATITAKNSSSSSTSNGVSGADAATAAAVAAAASGAPRGRGRGGSSRSSAQRQPQQQVFPEVDPPPELVTLAERKQMIAQQKLEGQMDMMTYSYARFMLSAVQVSSIAERVRFVLEGDAIAKVSRVVDHPVLGYQNSRQMGLAFAMLNDAWVGKARLLSREMAGKNLSIETRAGELRQKGNGYFKTGDFRKALDCYMDALQLTPTEVVLYCNISLTFLRMDKVDEAYDTARSAVAHDATSSKAWVRLGDACKAGSRWQLAQLCFSSAAILSPKDDVIKARHEEVCGRLAAVWQWQQVPAHWDKVAMAEWLGAARPPANTSNPAALRTWLSKLEKDVTNQQHTSRVIATELKQHWLTAEAMIAAQKGQLAALPALHEWQMSWSDTPTKGAVTGIVRYMVTVADLEASSPAGDALSPAPSMVEGQPTFADCIQAIAMSCFHPPNGLAPNKPTSLSLGHRMLDIFDQLWLVVKQEWGIDLTIETKVEAERASVQYDTDPMGKNYEDMGYMKLKLFKLTGKQSDPANDHAKDALNAAKAFNSNTAAAGSSSNSKQKRRSSAGTSADPPSSNGSSAVASKQVQEGSPSCRTSDSSKAPIAAAAAAGSSAATDGSLGSSSSSNACGTSAAGAAAAAAGAAAAGAAAAAAGAARDVTAEALPGGAGESSSAGGLCINMLSAKGFPRIAVAEGTDTWRELMSWDEETHAPVYSSTWQQVMDSKGGSSQDCMVDAAGSTSRAIPVVAAQGMMTWQTLLQELRCGKADEAALNALQSHSTT